MISDRVTQNMSPFNPDDTWDNYTETDFSKEVHTRTNNKYEADAVASSEAIIQAFNSSNAVQLLRDASKPLNYGNTMLSTQYMETRENKTNPNILAKSIRTENMVNEDFSLGVNYQVKSGTVQDRLGNMFEIWESQMPPADHDYTSTAQSSSDRRLEHIQGYDIKMEKKKSEVSGIVHPAEPSSYSHRTQVMKNEMEMNSREAFFNQNGLQPVQEFEQSREMYDGYNLKAGHENRAPKLEHSWRSDIYAETPKRASSNLPNTNMAKGLASKRKEACGKFVVKDANKTLPIGVSAKSAKLSLPVVNEATMRSQRSNKKMTPQITQGNIAQVASSSDQSIQKYGRLEISVEPKKTVETLEGPVPIASVEHVNTMRENTATAPKASREWSMIQQIAQGIDEMKADDTELKEIWDKSTLRGEAAAVHQSFDHIADHEMLARAPHQSQIHEASTIASSVHVSGTDVKEVEHTRKDTIAQAAAQKSVVEVTGTDSKQVENDRFAYINSNGPKLDSQQEMRTEDRKVKEGAIIHSIIAPEVKVSSHVTIDPNDRQQHGLMSQKSILHEAKPVSSTVQIGEEKGYLHRTGHMEGTSQVNSSRLASHQIPMEDRATYNVNRPGFYESNANMFDRNESLPETNRNQSNKFNDSKQFPVDATSIISQHQLTRVESGSFARTNSGHINHRSSIPAQQHIHSNAGMETLDRIHVPNKPDWRKNDALVQQGTTLSDDRSLGARAPSRTLATPTRITPVPSMEKNREVTQRMPVLSHTNRYTPLLQQSSRDDSS